MVGIAGMARRIPDYADGYLNWNSVMTLGSFLTLLSLAILFISTLADDADDADDASSSFANHPAFQIATIIPALELLALLLFRALPFAIDLAIPFSRQRWIWQ